MTDELRTLCLTNHNIDAFLAYKRVLVALWYKYRLNSYEVFFLLLTARLAGLQTNKIVPAYKIRKRLNASVNRVYSAMVDNLVSQGYLCEVGRGANYSRRIGITDQCIFFYEDYTHILAEIIQDDKDFFLLESKQ